MKCSSVQILASGVSQLEGDRVVVSVPRDAIRRIKLSHDSIVRHPFLQFFIGFVFVASGIILSIAAFIIDEAGVYLVRLQSRTFGVPVVPIVLVLMIWLGLRLLAQVLKGRYNFLVTTERGNCKIKFEQSADIREILSFVKRAELEFGYDVDMSITQQMHFPSDEA